MQHCLSKKVLGLLLLSSGMSMIDDKEVKIRHIENMTEQYGNQKMGAFILMLDYNVRHDDRFVHKIRITAENVKYHEGGENICFFQNSDFQ